MKITDDALQRLRGTAFGARLIEDRRFRVIAKAVCALTFHLLFVFYNGILGVLSSSILFVASSGYYFLLSLMRFSAVLLDRKGKAQQDRLTASVVGVMLIILSILFHIIVIVSIRDATATVYGEITMITIAAFTFTKITMAIFTAVKHRGEVSGFYRAVNAIRYSEVAVSLLTMQQSMLVSFEGGDDKSRIVLNACTGAGVCFFILVLGIVLLRSGRGMTDCARRREGSKKLKKHNSGVA